MPQDERILTKYQLVPNDEQSDRRVHLRSSETEEAVDFTFEALRPGLFRTTFSSRSHPLPPYPSARKPASETTKLLTSQDSSTSQSFLSDDIEAKLTWTSEPIVSLGFKDQPPLHSDLPHRSYCLDGPGVAHYTKYARGSLHLGLGEKAAPMDLSNRHFTLSATDCFGYDVHRSDPMYKYIPLLIRAGPEGVVATFSTAHARGYYSVGSEMDGMWGYFKVYRQEHGGLEEYLMIGKTLQEVVHLYATLVGFPQLVPRWAMGYLGGGMKYSMLDDPPAHEALLAFANKLNEHDIPCSGFQMSSGYTVAEQEPKTRNVFTWNRHRFPDPKAFCDEFHRRGIRLIANIKPYVLANHPAYAELEKKGAFFTDPRTGGTGIARLWSAGGGTSGEGGHIDFTSQAGWDFWYDGVRALRETGMDCMWNDNNEYLVPSDKWEFALSHPAVHDGVSSNTERTERKDIGLWGRAMQTELHAACSHAALTSLLPTERPFILTRSATAGTMRYASSTWSGDNVTSWPGMRGANALSLTAGVSLLPSYGHDIGGFEGPQPSPELLLRWIQLGCHSPRFAINCYKTGSDSLVGDVIEPWMYPEIVPHIRAAIKRRYEMIPYLYSLMLESTRTAVPPQRWTGWGYEGDAEVWSSQLLKEGETQYWLGDTLLVGGVYEAGEEEARVYLPRQTHNRRIRTTTSTPANEAKPQTLNPTPNLTASEQGFLNTNPPYQFLPSGTWHTIPSRWKDSIPILARIGGLVPIGRDIQTVAPGDRVNEAGLPADDWRGVEIFPLPADKIAEDVDGSVDGDGDGHGDRGGDAGAADTDAAAPPEQNWHTNAWHEDDGLSPAPLNKTATFTISYLALKTEVEVTFASEGTQSFEPSWLKHGLDILMPVGDGRRVVAVAVAIAEEGGDGGGGGEVVDCGLDARGRRRWRLVPAPRSMVAKL